MQPSSYCCLSCLALDAQRDKLATELSWKRFASKVAHLQLLRLHLTYPTCIWRLRWGWVRLSFAEVFGIRKLRVSGLSRGVVCVILRLAVSAEHRLVTDEQTDRHTRGQQIPSLASVERVKINWKWSAVTMIDRLITLTIHHCVTVSLLTENSPVWQILLVHRTHLSFLGTASTD